MRLTSFDRDPVHAYGALSAYDYQPSGSRSWATDLNLGSFTVLPVVCIHLIRMCYHEALQLHHPFLPVFSIDPMRLQHMTLLFGFLLASPPIL